MTARYSLKYIRKYLTDGGHFENSGAYRLIEARIPLIIVCDVGSDPGYQFQDLENLIRTVRLDFGYETEILGDAKLAEFLKSYGGASGPVFADPDKWPDWRNAFTSPDCREFAVALRVLTPGEHLHIIWMKPRLLADAPADILGYAADNPQFPQQSTEARFSMKTMGIVPAVWASSDDADCRRLSHSARSNFLTTESRCDCTQGSCGWSIMMISRRFAIRHSAVGTTGVAIAPIEALLPLENSMIVVERLASGPRMRTRTRR